MAGFSELTRSFDKIRDYMRDFYIYGFQHRGEMGRKSPRTYDNEKRRIESYLSPFVRWGYDKKGKRTFLSLDASALPVNPLYAAWKSKSFTNMDIMLHFYILDALQNGQELGIEPLTDRICAQSGRVFEAQTVRLKCKEYHREGILTARKQGKALLYRYSAPAPGSAQLPEHELSPLLQFYQGAAPFGEIGSYLLDALRTENTLFRFAHHYVVHTLEDGILLELLQAMRAGREVTLQSLSRRRGAANTPVTGVPLKILSSAVTGRRYLCLYRPQRRRFTSHRLDSIKKVASGAPYPEYQELQAALERCLPLVWGVAFGGRSRKELVCMKLAIDEEREPYLLDRLAREGRGGEIIRLEKNRFLYTRELYDTNEISPWIKTFTGRIIALEGTNREVIARFYRDMAGMRAMYWKGAGL